MPNSSGNQSPSKNNPITASPARRGFVAPPSVQDYEYWKDASLLLSLLNEGVFAYIGDVKSLNLPVFHSDVLLPEEQARGYGIFVSVNGFKSSTGRCRYRENILSLNGNFIDIDMPAPKEAGAMWTDEDRAAWKSETLNFLTTTCTEAGVLPTAIVETWKGYHVYFLYNEPIYIDRILRLVDESGNPCTTPDGTTLDDLIRDPSLLAPGTRLVRDEDRINRLFEVYGYIQEALITIFAGDPLAKDLSRVLRVPQTYHLKDPVHPFLIKLIHCAPENRYSFKTIRDAFIPLKDLPNPKIQAWMEATKANELKSLADPTDPLNLIFRQATNLNEPIPQYALDKLNQLYPKVDRPSIQSLMRKTGQAPGSRNHSLLIAVSALRESGWSEAQCEAEFDQYNGLPLHEIRSVIRSVFKNPKSYEFGWNNHLVQAHVTYEEQAKVRAILAEATKEYREEQRRKRGRKDLIEQDENLKRNSERNAGSPGMVESDHGRISDDVTSGNPEPYATGGAGANVGLHQERQHVESNNKAEQRSEEERPEVDHSFPIDQQKQVDKAHKFLANVAKREQEILYQRYEDLILARHPYIRYVEQLGFIDYVDGRYELLSDDKVDALILNEMLKDGLLNFRTRSGVENKIKCLKSIESIRINQHDMDRDARLLNLENGLLDIETGILYPHDPAYFSMNQLSVRWDAATPIENLAPRWIRFIQEVTVGDQDKARLLQEIAGYCFTKEVWLHKAFILYGAGANGKSTFIETIAKMLGRQNTSYLTLKQIHEQFALFGLYGKRLNVVEEISENYFESDMVKKIITGVQIEADRKFKSSIKFTPFSKIVFAVNSLPKIRDTSHGLYRRLIIVPFTAVFDPSQEPGLPDTLWAERAGVLKWAVEGWKRLREQRRFTTSPDIIQASEDFKEMNSPITEFILTTYDVDPTYDSRFLIPAKNVFAAYREFCREMGYSAKAYQNFLHEMKTLTHSSLSHVQVSSANKSDAIRGLMFKENSLKPKL